MGGFCCCMIVIHHSHVDMAARSLILHLAHVQARMAREMITARALDSREYRVRKGHGPMTCMFCRSSVLSKAHKHQCIEVRMYENRSLQRPLHRFVDRQNRNDIARASPGHRHHTEYYLSRIAKPKCVFLCPYTRSMGKEHL